MPEERTEEEVFEVAGEKVTRQEWEAFKNDRNWRKTNTDTAEKLSQKERALEAEKAELAETRRQVAAERADAAERTRLPRGNAEEEVDREPQPPQLPSLPNAIDDPAEYNRVVEERERLRDEYNRKLRAYDARQARREVAAVKSEATTSANVTVAQAAAFQRNRETINGYVSRMEKEGHPLSVSEQQRLVKYMDTSLRLPEESMGQKDRASGVFVFTEEALVAGDAYVRREHWREVAKQEGYKEAEKAGAVNGRANNGLPLSAGKPPGANATGQEIFEFAQKLPPSAQERYIDGLPDKQKDAFHKYLPRGLEEAEIGA